MRKGNKMKIIGKTERGFIVEIETTELEKLTGYYYEKKRFSVNEHIKVDALYNQLKSLVALEEEIKKMSHTLKTAAGMLEKIDPIFYNDE